MKYFTTVIQILNNGETAQSVHTFDTRDEAFASLYSEMAYGINIKLNGIVCNVVDMSGSLHKMESWTNPEAVAAANTEE